MKTKAITKIPRPNKKVMLLRDKINTLKALIIDDISKSMGMLFALNTATNSVEEIDLRIDTQKINTLVEHLHKYQDELYQLIKKQLTK